MYAHSGGHVQLGMHGFFSLEGEGRVGRGSHPLGQELQHVLALLSSLQGGEPRQVRLTHTQELMV